ncbi:hypothetical protein A2U01_0086891, partial [Trifolium medium]|nr:hypothetical protein [Trifolium medium]
VPIPRADDIDLLILAQRTLGFAVVDIAHVNNAVIKVLADDGTEINMAALEYSLSSHQPVL